LKRNLILILAITSGILAAVAYFYYDRDSKDANQIIEIARAAVSKGFTSYPVLLQIEGEILIDYPYITPNFVMENFHDRIIERITIHQGGCDFDEISIDINDSFGWFKIYSSVINFKFTNCIGVMKLSSATVEEFTL
jgi:hypothetical protein